MIKLHFYIARTQWFITKYNDLLQKRKLINSKSLVLLASKTTLFPFLYSKYIDSYIPTCLRIWRPGSNHWLNNEKSPMLIKTFKILQTLCAVYGWEVVTQASLPAERFDLRHPCHTQGRELAAIIGTTNEKPFTNIIPNQPTILTISNFPKESTFSKSKTSCASQVGRL